MLIVAFACFLILFVAWLLVPTSGRADAIAPGIAALTPEAIGD